MRARHFVALAIHFAVAWPLHPCSGMGAIAYS